VASLDRTDQPANQQSRQAGLSANEKPAQPATPPKVREGFDEKYFFGYENWAIIVLITVIHLKTFTNHAVCVS
jgi:hypothetical protein